MKAELEEKIDVVFLMSTECLCSNIVMTTEFSMQLVRRSLRIARSYRKKNHYFLTNYEDAYMEASVIKWFIKNYYQLILYKIAKTSGLYGCAL